MDNFDQINMMYACIAVLRVLALKKSSRTDWDAYTKFESHLEQRMKTEVYTKVGFLCALLPIVDLRQLFERNYCVCMK